MFKSKVVGLIAAMSVSLSAQAGLIQHNLDVQYQDGSVVRGYLLQDEANQGIAHFRLTLETSRGLTYFNAEQAYSDILNPYFSSYGPGLPNFTVFTTQDMNYDSRLTFTFSRYGVGGYKAIYQHHPHFPPSNLIEFSRVAHGGVWSQPIDPWILEEFKAQCGMTLECLNAETPAPMPEPGSFALLALAAAGLYSARRRKAA